MNEWTNNLKEKYKELCDYLNGLSVYEVRNIAREKGIHSPTTEKKGCLLEKIIRIEEGLDKPLEKIGKGKGRNPNKGSEEIVQKHLREVNRIVAHIKAREAYVYEGESGGSIVVGDSDANSITRGIYGETLKTGFLNIDDDKKYTVACGNGIKIVEEIALPKSIVEKNNLRLGDKVRGVLREISNGTYEIREILSVNEKTDIDFNRPIFEDLTPCYSTERFYLGKIDPALRAIDLLYPIAKGQRTIVSGPSASGKTRLLLRMVQALAEGGGDIDLVILLIAARPEEVTAFKEAAPNAELFTTASDMSERQHTRIAALAFEYSKRLVESGRDVVAFADCLTDLAGTETVRPRFEAFNPVKDVKRFFSLGRNLREKGSLTVIASARTEETKPSYAYIQLKSAANAELVLCENLRERRIFPPVNYKNSFTYGDECLFTEEELCDKMQIRSALIGEEGVEALYQAVEALPEKVNALRFISDTLRNER